MPPSNMHPHLSVSPRHRVYHLTKRVQVRPHTRWLCGTYEMATAVREPNELSASSVRSRTTYAAELEIRVWPIDGTLAPPALDTWHAAQL